MASPAQSPKPRRRRIRWRKLLPPSSSTSTLRRPANLRLCPALATPTRRKSLPDVPTAPNSISFTRKLFPKVLTTKSKTRLSPISRNPAPQFRQHQNNRAGLPEPFWELSCPDYAFSSIAFPLSVEDNLVVFRKRFEPR